MPELEVMITAAMVRFLSTDEFALLSSAMLPACSCHRHICCIVSVNMFSSRPSCIIETGPMQTHACSVHRFSEASHCLQIGDLVLTEVYTVA